MDLSIPLCLLLLLAGCQAQEASDPVADPRHTSYLAQIKGPLYSTAEAWAAFQPSARHQEIVAAAPDTWEVLPKTLDPKYRNPCWTDAAGLFRCMPYFQILGVSKCGTTDLYARLRRHPEFADGSKGPHFWDECPFPPRSACTAPPHGNFDGYVNLFQKGAHMIKSQPTAVTGEASSNTFTAVYTYVRGLAQRRSLNVTLAELIHEAQPYSRHIVLMRDPVSRYYSAFHYYRRNKKAAFEPPENFHERAVAEIAAWDGCLAKASVRQCIKRYHPQQLIKGMYSEFVEAWTSVFPREQLIFLRNEDYQKSILEHLRAVSRFLGLREDGLDGLVRAKRSNQQRYPDMLPATRALLEKFYMPFNQRLAALLKDDRYLWSDTFGAAAAGVGGVTPAAAEASASVVSEYAGTQ